MIYSNYKELKGAVDKKLGIETPDEAWDTYASFSFHNFHPPFDDEDLKNAVFAIKKLMDNMNGKG